MRYHKHPHTKLVKKKNHANNVRLENLVRSIGTAGSYRKALNSFRNNDENLFFFPPMHHVDHARLGRHPVIFHSGYDRNANARILAAFCYGQQSRNVGVARGVGRTGEIRQNFSVAGPDNSGADKQNKRRPDIRRRRESTRTRIQ